MVIGDLGGAAMLRHILPRTRMRGRVEAKMMRQSAWSLISTYLITITH